MYAASTDTRSSQENTTSEWGLGQDPGWMMHLAAALCPSSTGAVWSNPSLKRPHFRPARGALVLVSSKIRRDREDRR